MNKFIITIGFASVAACSKSDSHSKNEPAAGPSVGEKTAESAKPTAPKSEYKPDELWTKVSGMSRIDLLELAAAGVTVTGTVQKVSDDPTSEFTLDLDAGSSHVVAMTFGDFGKAAKAKGIKAGAAVTATKCAVTNPAANRLAVVQCELK